MAAVMVNNPSDTQASEVLKTSEASDKMPNIFESVKARLLLADQVTESTSEAGLFLVAL
jgi:hypothetical protein